MSICRPVTREVQHENVRTQSSCHLQVLRGNKNSITDEVASLPKTLNGPQVKVTSKTVSSLEMLICVLEKLNED